MLDGFWGYVVVAVLAALVAVGELTNRYTDRPSAALREPAAVAYLLINAAASLVALYVIRVFQWEFSIDEADAVSLVQVAVAGLGALALFRLKLFTAAVNEETVSFGPSRVLERLLAVADRQMDRRQAADRAALLQEVTRDLSFDKAAKTLPSQALTLLESVDDETQERLGEDVRSLINDEQMDQDQKIQLLIAAVLRVTGPDLLRSAVDALGDTIRK